MLSAAGATAWLYLDAANGLREPAGSRADMRWWSQPIPQQITGYALLLLMLSPLFLSAMSQGKSRAAAKASNGENPGTTAFRTKHGNGTSARRRLQHSLLGLGSLFLLAAHTGFDLGANFNRFCGAAFLCLVALGGAAALLRSFGGKPDNNTNKRGQGLGAGHVFLVPLVLGIALFHLLAVYYF